MYLESLTKRLLAAAPSIKAELRGCTPAEIASLEQNLGIKLPIAYQEFLRIMGKGAGQFLRGSDCFYPEIKELQSAAVEILAENQFNTALPPDAFVFFMHQGYQFSFFRLKEGDNPPVYFYCEGETSEDFVKTHSRVH